MSSKDPNVLDKNFELSSNKAFYETKIFFDLQIPLPKKQLLSFSSNPQTILELISSKSHTDNGEKNKHDVSSLGQDKNTTILTKT